jgi:LmbE family N-acetylglucosaminyl deacetylase
MAVHAHPDDESSSTGGVFARYGDEGITTVLVTCTNGEYGDGPAHVKPGEEGHDPEQVAKTRLAELADHDSGMPDWPYKDHEHTFANVPFDEPVSRLVTLIEQYEPDVIVTYDDMGGYNHPDHLQAHRIAVEAFRTTDVASKLYFIARRRRDFEKLRERMEAAGVDMPAPPQREIPPEVLEQMEQAEARITTTVDTSA